MSTGSSSSAALQPIAFIDLTGETPKEIDIVDLWREDSNESSYSSSSSDEDLGADSDEDSSLDSIPLPPPTGEIERNMENSAVDSIPLPHPTGNSERRMEDSDVASIPLPPPSGAIKRKLEDSAPLVSKKAHELAGLEGSDEDALFEAELFIQKLNKNEGELGKIHQVLDQLVIDIVKPISQMKMVENQWMQEQLKIIFEKNLKIQQKFHIQIEIKKTEVLDVKEQIKMEQKRRWNLLNAIDPETHAVFVEADEGAGSDIPTNRAELAELAVRIEKVTKKSSRIQALDKRINACRISIDNCFRAKNHYATIEMKLEETNQEIDVLKAENLRLQRVIEEMDESIKKHKEKLEEFKNKMKSYRDFAERLTGNVVDRKCPICLEEFHGPETDDRSPRFFGN